MKSQTSSAFLAVARQSLSSPRLSERPVLQTFTRAVFALLTVSLASWTGQSVSGDDRIQLTETRNIDGSGNSIGGAANTPLLRKLPADYPDDGSGETITEWPDRENPRAISNVVADQPNSLVNNRRRNDYCGGQVSVASLAADQTGIIDLSTSKRRYTKVPAALSLGLGTICRS